ncbi:calcium-binding protein [Microseira wollei]|uniref:Hemolysin-type calcium-binding region n=1 Tax=Microseira wollei NIES-4236 TaxID=2530354 RepID=A0AAV3XJK9_9CYAN|nr:calcium-binding protein [Microseira wollei]GET41701.1 hypothetical protein MiSe_65150 [Microseira wollei NIES-4236]
MTSSTQIIQSHIDNQPASGKDFSGSRKDDIFLGDDQNNVADGKEGDDILFGKGGDDLLNGGIGDDLILGGGGNDSLKGDPGRDLIFGDAGDDQIDGGSGSDFLDGGVGKDKILGDIGDDIIVGGDGVDTLTGGRGDDRFVYSGNPFANGTPAPAGNTGIKVLNQPDIITDYEIRKDQFVLDSSDLGIDNIIFQKGNSSQISGNSNVIVLLNPFPAAGAAAKAIADNNQITSDEGVFVYFNTTLGISRLVYSKDLSDGGDISVLANLNNQAGNAGLANLANFSANDFSLA